jgi:cyclic beta-1,2-glucan synthetase
VRHGQGYSAFESVHGGLKVETTYFADINDPIKLVQLRLHNQGSETRQLRALAMVEWQMGGARHERRTVRTWKSDAQALTAVFAKQRESRAGFGGNTAFLSAAGLPGPLQWTCDRSEFFDSAGQLVIPAALGQSATGGADPCAALAGDFALAPGQSMSLTFMLGHAADPAAAEQLARNWQHAIPRKRWSRSRRIGPACWASCRCARPTRSSTRWSTAG